ncbi:MAG: O-antigen ligase family protein [Christensenellales bacterium]|jgi:hypothetical protein
MNLTKKVFSKEYLLSLFIMLPYVEFGPIYHVLSFSVDGVVFRAGQLMLFVSTFVLALLALQAKRHFGRQSKVLLVLLALILLIPVRWLFVENKDPAVFLAQYLNLILPLIFAFVYTNTIRSMGVCQKTLFRYVLFNFVIYSTVILLYNILVRKVLIDRTIRLHGPGGGAVIYGYTVFLMIVFALNIRKFISKRSFFLSLLIMLIVVYATASRAAIVLSAFVIFLYILMRLPKRTIAILLLLTATALMLINPIDIFQKIIPRFFSLSAKDSTNARINTVLVSLRALFGSSWPVVLFGMGYSTVFPYLRWLNDFRIDSTITNQFHYGDEYMLVQPHNTLIYLSHETGLVGAILFILFFVCMQMKLCKERRPMIISVFLWGFLVVNLFDSIVIIHPLASAVMWTLLFLLAVPIDMPNDKLHNEKSTNK